MTASEHGNGLERQIAQWRGFLHRRQAIHTVDVEELEDHLRGQIATLVDAGLAADEAFLVAVKRMGDLDELSSEFAREHAERLWKQMVVAPETAGHAGTRSEATVVIGLAALAAVVFMQARGKKDSMRSFIQLYLAPNPVSPSVSRIDCGRCG